jgi:hypothetical protein
MGGWEHVTPTGVEEWRSRLTLVTEGPWRWRWRATHRGSACATPWQDVDVGPAPPGAHGFLRASPRDSRYLEHLDGTPYFAVGENLAWPDGRGTMAYQDWLDKLSAQGANYARIWMAPWSFALEWTRRDEGGALVSSSLGDYRERMGQAWQLDQVLEAARARNVSVMLCLLNHGQFSSAVNSDWADNPYNDDNGGPLARPTDFFTDDQARALFARRLRYVVGRWGHATNILAWELWNEVDNTLQLDVETLVEWHETMARELLVLDGARHLVTTSTGALGMVLGLDPALFSLPEMGLSQFHLYGSDRIQVDFTAVITERVADLLVHGKPVLAAEVGVDFRGPAETMERDPTLVGFRDILWIPVLAGSAGTGMHWWWDNMVDPQDLYPVFGSVSRLVANLDPAGEAFTTSWESVTHGQTEVDVLRLAGRTAHLAWVKNRADTYSSGGDDSLVAGLAVPMPGVLPGCWSVTWLDPAAVETHVPLTWAGGEPLPVPSFRGSLGVRLDACRPP